ncbi:MAG: GNAT family acetyltransferase [SAR86 cluster bacterium]|uniref:GNAT family acetyltransferase n=1 Tax=SAR86 cluster bacterium TaxID=2030880 RepID=A0A2A5CGD1_9GAMM|nr:GNAT family acetyltransferase [bacterium AH-315-I11]MBN4075848.1 GNAT family acetyltransferase [Gammaproteobacteria bacterium AH-315-E17]PCJ42565.1 MAG: GNAT family acetyltransferase [SAR86 cluster bacterium]
MEIRQFNNDDTQAVIALWQACGLLRPWNDPNKGIERKLAVQPELFLVGLTENKIIASVMAGYDGHRGSVYYLAVEPGQQKMGYGRKLMEATEELLTRLGCPKLNILVRSSNLEAIDFYLSLAYKQDEVISIGKRLIKDGSK